MATESSMFFRFSCRSNFSSFSGRKQGGEQIVWAHLLLASASALWQMRVHTIESRGVPTQLLHFFIHKNDYPPWSAQILNHLWLQILAQRHPSTQGCSTILQMQWKWRMECIRSSKRPHLIAKLGADLALPGECSGLPLLAGHGRGVLCGVPPCRESHLAN